MFIREMFKEDINRSINGVIKVQQDAPEVIEQELREYVITKELKKHFISFFNAFCDALDAPTANIGVWLTGFFGSGKSHLLKMIAYILENKTVNGVSTVEIFREKFEDDPGTFMLIDQATRGQNEPILFNIDIEGPADKNNTAVLRVFAKMFYNHLGFYGENLKVAMLEQYIEQLGKTEAFRRVFEAKKGKPWVEQRKAFAFNGKYIIPTLTEVLDVSEEDAKNWFHDKTEQDMSIARLVADIKAYADSKPDNFRLLFMADEVGQYVGTDTNLLLNLQSLIEKIGSDCAGKVWVVCTGQEAIDEIIKVRSDEFSRIQARFGTRMSLSSSSVDEVIQKRVLSKKDEAKNRLDSLYDENDSVLRNLFTFSGAVSDIRGFGSNEDFVMNFPFIPYQFTVMQKVFAEIRKHGNSGKHLSGGERSMLSGFQEAAQAVQTQDEYALVPFFLFYDTVHSFLDSSIRRVIERCERAAENGHGLESYDVEVLKLLYLIRYVDDIPANADNIVILMADDLRADKIVLREKVRDSLNRLYKDNYIGRSGEIYHFLTDEEQDIQREINNTSVDTSSIRKEISDIIFGDIYSANNKFRYGKYDFTYQRMVDDYVSGNSNGEMQLRFMTIAIDPIEKNELRLITNSKGKAIVVLADSLYFESLEYAKKIEKYVKQRNVSQLPRSVQDIIKKHQDEATRRKLTATDALKEAIAQAQFYVDGEHLEIRSGDAKSKIDQALEYLVGHVYSELDLITKNVDGDADILEILNGGQSMIPGAEPNRDAAAKIEEYLTVQKRTNLPTSMADVQSRYKAIPYGWREIDIAAVVALLIHQQRVTVKYGGMTIQPDHRKLVDMLRKKSEIGNTKISIREKISTQKMKQVKDILNEYFDVMKVPDDEDTLVAWIVKKFEEEKSHFESLLSPYQTKDQYPDHSKLVKGIELIDSVLSQKTDNIALIDRVIKLEDDLFDNKEDLMDLEDFFKNQAAIFDAAVHLDKSLRDQLNYIENQEDANAALKSIRVITLVKPDFNYKRIPELNALMAKVKEGHEALIQDKRKEVMDVLVQCRGAIHQAAGESIKAKDEVIKADRFYDKKKDDINNCHHLAILDGFIPQMIQYKDSTCESIQKIKTPVRTKPQKPSGGNEGKEKKVIKAYNRQVLFPQRKLESEEDIDAYVDEIRKQLKEYLRSCDGIQLK